tara:strand:+ start:248 stop:547 length:300 start_codon:yes stop_codon:yes gene_type:complete
MCAVIRDILTAQGKRSPFTGGAGTAPGDRLPGEQESQGDDYRGRRYWRRRRRERAGDYWDSRRGRDRAWERPPAPEDDLRIPEPDINDPNQTSDGGINY